MIQLTANESRVLGVLVEKATTTPEQYPLSLNAATNGSNQKNNRDPVTSLTDDQVFDALEGLRVKGLAIRVDMPGNRVHKYRHNATEVLHIRTAELAILAELLLRGPQTMGELRTRASRMAPLESLETVKGMLTSLMSGDEPMVRELPPSPGFRTDRFVQLLCADLHPLQGPAAETVSTNVSEPSDRLGRLEAKVEALSATLHRLMEKLGESDETV